VQRCDKITAEDAHKKWSKCFKELVELDGQYHIILKSGSKPFALTKPKRTASIPANLWRAKRVRFGATTPHHFF